MSPNNTLFLAFGHRCSSAAILDRSGLSGPSFPFDAVVSKLSVVRHCLEDDFKEFLDIQNYQKVNTTTVNIIDGVVETLLTEFPSVNRRYERLTRPGGSEGAAGGLTGASTYHLQLALTHHDLHVREDYEAFARRIALLRDVLTHDRKKVCLYIHPVMGINDYHDQRDGLLDEFQAFAAFFAGRYSHACGLFFIIVKLRGRVPKDNTAVLLKNDVCSVYAIFANPDFVDANAPFTGDFERETQSIMDIVKGQEFSRPPLYNIYFPLFDDVESTSNEMRLTLEGLRAHPQVKLVDHPEHADYLIFCQSHLSDTHAFHAGFRALKDRYKEKTVMLDYGDAPETLFDAEDFRWRLYFKRSCVDRAVGRAIHYGALPVRATAYGVVNDMCDPPAGDDARSLDVSCLFDDCVVDTPYFSLARGRLLKFAKRLAFTHRALSMQIGTVSECGPVGRSKVDPGYKRCLYDSKIVLHANPDPWEGDSRLWEALASGALVFVDRMYAPIKNPLIDGVHLIFYDLTDEGMNLLEQRIIHYLSHDLERQRLGAQGRQFVMTHHRSFNRVDEIIRALECTGPATAYPVRGDPDLDIIVSIATGYTNIDQYRPFIASLRRAGATCPVFLGISDGPEYGPVKRYLLENAINYFIVPPHSPAGVVVNGFRFAQYKEWLRDLDFRYALLLDFRDVYFQRDPFVDVEAFMRDCDLYLMSEFSFLTVGNHPNGMNYAWVAEPFGKTAADAVADKAILNSGALLGRKGAVMKLLEVLAEVTTQQGFAFADQGTLNYFGHTGGLDSCGRIKVAPAGQSLVNNCGFTELDLLREVRPLTVQEEAQIAFIPRTEQGRLKLYRDHQGWVLDDDGNISYAVHQYDRFLPEMLEFVSSLSDYDSPERVFVRSATRPYRGEMYTLSSRDELRPDAVEALIATIKNVSLGGKPLLTLSADFERGFFFAYGTLNNDLLFASQALRQNFGERTCDAVERARFLRERGYEIHLVKESAVFLAPAAPRGPVQTAQSFSEARAQAERWSPRDHRTDRIQHIVSAWKGHEEFAVKLVEYLQPAVVVELGVDFGFSAFAFALPNIGTVYGIDRFQGPDGPPEGGGLRNSYDEVLREKERLGLSNVVLIASDFTQAAESWERPIDVLHIDGDHDYKSVKRDFVHWSRFVNDGGVILMHDTMSFPEDVGRFFNEVGLPKFNFTHSHGLGVICRKQDLLDRVLRL